MLAGDLCVLGCGQYFIGAHHFVVFVLQDVAVPDIAASEAFEGNDDACDQAVKRTVPLS
jgi:hypothetical protein